MKIKSVLICLLAAISLSDNVFALEVAWNRICGRYSVESVPALLDVNNDGTEELVLVSTDGWVMLWDIDGNELKRTLVSDKKWPKSKAEWPNPPIAFMDGAKPKIVVVNLDGKIVCLSGQLEQLWTAQLPGKVQWARCIPALVGRKGAGLALVFSDISGTLTKMDTNGNILFSKKMGYGPSKAPIRIADIDKDSEEELLVGFGSTLCCFSSEGKEKWTADLQGEISCQPEIVTDWGQPKILCGSASEKLFCLSASGKILWQANVGDDIDRTICLVPQKNGKPLVVCCGVWGNLHAFNSRGKPVWTTVFDRKVRRRPVLFDTDLDGEPEIVLATYASHLYAYNSNGDLKDEVSLSDLINCEPLVLPNNRIVVTLSNSSVVALAASPARSQFGSPADRPENVAIRFYPLDEDSRTYSVQIENPQGRLIRASLKIREQSGHTRIRTVMTSQSLFELSLAEDENKKAVSVEAEVASAQGEILKKVRYADTKQNKLAAPEATKSRFHIWVTEPYCPFGQNRLRSVFQEQMLYPHLTMEHNTLYQNEADQMSLALVSKVKTLLTLRLHIEQPKKQDGTSFSGTLVWRQVIHTPSEDGIMVADALPSLNSANILKLYPGVKETLWLCVDTGDCEPGSYEGKVHIDAIDTSQERLTIPLRLKVLPLKISSPFPMTFCTWAYLPNQWFEDFDTAQRDMFRHGVSVFVLIRDWPLPQVDEKGNIIIDWEAHDAFLSQWRGHGTILFCQGLCPAIQFPEKPDSATYHKAQIEFLRKWRDHLAEKGLGFEDYAFYIIDELGLGHGRRVAPLIKYAKLLKEADPQLRIYANPGYNLSMEDFDSFKTYIDVWAPVMRFLRGGYSKDPRIEWILSSGKTLWSYECVAQTKGIHPLVYNRANAWRGLFLGLEGIGTWTHCTTGYDPWLYHTSKRFYEHAMVYPGDSAVPSKRWEAARDGLEDAAAVFLLRAQIKKARQMQQSSEFCNRAEEAIRLAVSDFTQMSDYAFIESRDFLKAGARIIHGTWSDALLYQKHRQTIADFSLKLSEVLK